MKAAGGVRSAREQLRVTTHLVDGASGFYIWSESIDIPLADPVAGQEEIAKRIAAKLAPEVFDGTGSVGVRRQSDNLAAWNLYLQGRYHLNQRTEESLHMARLDEALEQVLLAQALDPVSSIIARDVAVVHYYRRDFDAALEQCDHTIELNPHFAPAYHTLGLVQEQRRDLD